MDSALVASLSGGFITGISGLVGDNLPAILVFVGAVLVWGIAKKYIFGGASRI